MVGVLVEM